ncbi:LytR/AlgR family response regulator transcription factor [Lacinutrix jangbogonensis]|uniref:LytR/AlgR family response regulator transcription factor n=1 Tax=Lacinutrix jangbogonensis TaxID=1469557 RepID=UPI00053E8DD6|nr:LytTR family DNA-binding domain-containing protein [Lacinutrix jangbogonensis]
MNNSIKAIIVDDEIHARENLIYLLDNFCANVTVIGEASNVDTAIGLIESLRPNLVFLDIEMPRKNGFELMSHFKTIDFQVIFITAYDQYAIKAFEVSAIDYLLKPIAIDRLKGAIEKVLLQEEQLQITERFQALKENNNQKSIKRLSIPYKSDYVIISIADIILIEADRMYSNLCVEGKLASKTYTYAKKLRDFEDIFDDLDNFIRIHRSWIININYLQSYSKKDKEVLLINNKRIPVSKSYKEKLEKLLGFDA